MSLDLGVGKVFLTVQKMLLVNAGRKMRISSAGALTVPSPAVKGKVSDFQR